MRKLNYLVDIEGNEMLLEKFIEAIDNGTCRIRMNNARADSYQLPTGEKFLNSSIINYFFRTRPAQKYLYISFFEKLRNLEPRGFNEISYTIGQCFKKRISKGYFNTSPSWWAEEIKEDPMGDYFSKLRGEEKTEVPPNDAWIAKEKLLQENPALCNEAKEILSILCYVAVCHIKYGASFETVTANEYFDLVTAWGSDEVEKMKKMGTGNLPKELTDYKDETLACKANDVFATISIKAKNDIEETYSKALDFMNALLKTDFPKSYSIEFSSPQKMALPINGLPKCGQNYVFAGAVKFPNLHTKMEEYIRLSKKKWEWYTNLSEGENCAMPSTFAVFALGLEDEKYFTIVNDYFDVIDDEHQEIHKNFTAPFLEKFGVTAQTIQVYIKCLSSMQWHPHYKLFLNLFSTEKSLNVLLDHKNNFIQYYLTSADGKVVTDNTSSTERIAEYMWRTVMNTTFGKDEQFDKIAKKMNEPERMIFEELRKK